MISIIIPAHNEFGNLKRLFKVIDFFDSHLLSEISVALSPHNNDGSISLKEEFNINFIACSKKGRAAQMNQAAKVAKGTILVFLHADVIPPENFLNDIKKTITDGNKAGFFSYKFDKSSWLLKINASFTAKDGIFTGGGDQCLFITKNAFFRLNGFDENQVLMEDFELFKRIRKNKIPYKIVKNDLIVSARKYEHNSYLRVNLSNLLLVILFKLGVCSKTLKTVHNKLVRTSYNG